MTAGDVTRTAAAGGSWLSRVGDILNDGLRGMRREPGAVIAYGALIVVLILWSLNTPTITSKSVTWIVMGMVPAVMAAVGMAIVLIAKGIDLSMGPMVVLAQMIVLSWTVPLHSPWLATLAALLVTSALGMLSGLMVGVVKLPALVVTLAMGSIASGLALYVAPKAVSGTLPASFTTIAQVIVAGVPLMIILAFALPALIWFPIRRSRAGLALLAVGGDESAAFVSGLKPWRSQALAFALSGLFAGLAGTLLAMVTNGASASTPSTYTLNAIAAAVLGGVSLVGGRGSIAGAIGGAFVLTFIQNLLQAWHINTYWGYVVSGTILVLVVGVPYLINQARARAAGGVSLHRKAAHA